MHPYFIGEVSVLKLKTLRSLDGFPSVMPVVFALPMCLPMLSLCIIQ